MLSSTFRSDHALKAQAIHPHFQQLEIITILQSPVKEATKQPLWEAVSWSRFMQKCE
ncbi:hypothetical protein PORCRE_1383 [Porphyromonas crevioricanis JCM 15906]|uniref:Uncharacterized protein n=1 Tax=Porphyromonas crevioricanis JCM 15906 TaxID=1305617 RepID=T1CRG8_9PORP|nr:hypothetical protein PORCRE_1383 [Porphyromonas crevioricanis JCM 15906]